MAKCNMKFWRRLPHCAMKVLVGIFFGLLEAVESEDITQNWFYRIPSTKIAFQGKDQ